MEVDWETLGVQLLERERRPVFVLNDRGRVVRTNRAFVYLLREGTLVHNVDFRNDWLRSESRLKFDDALDQLGTENHAQVQVSLTNTVFPVDLVLELSLIGTPQQPSILAVMVDAVSRMPLMPLRPAAGMSYEVVVEKGEPRRVTRLVAADGATVQAPSVSKPCWEHLFGRAEACSQCPVRKLEGTTQAAAVFASGSANFQPQVVVAQRRGADMVVVTTIPVDGQLYSELVAARVEHLAQQAELTPRERELLSLLLLGRSLDEVSTVSGIAPRTAKYHQQNLLKKIGADSRLDLTRFIL